MRDELERIWKKAAVAQFQVPAGGTEEHHVNLNRGSRSSGRDVNPGSPEYEGMLTTTFGGLYVTFKICMQVAGCCMFVLATSNECERPVTDRKSHVTTRAKVYLYRKNLKLVNTPTDLEQVVSPT
jgi:hypothetical protein